MVVLQGSKWLDVFQRVTSGSWRNEALTLLRCPDMPFVCADPSPCAHAPVQLLHERY